MVPPGLLICGFPRSGSTLLYCMLRYTVEGYEFLLHEQVGIRPGVVTKFPKAIFDIDENEAERAIITIRDPREILTSFHGADKYRGKGYFMSAHSSLTDERRGVVEFWYAIRKRPQAFVVRYEELVNRPRKVQQQLGERFGLTYKPGRFFDEFHREPHGQYWETAMSGRRPLKPRIWRERAQRFEEQLNAHPELLDVIREMGYGEA